MAGQEPDIETLRKLIPASLNNGNVVSARLTRREMKKLGARVAAWLTLQLTTGDTVQPDAGMAKYGAGDSAPFIAQDEGWYGRAYYPTNTTPALPEIAALNAWNEGELLPAKQTGRDWVIPALDAAEELLAHTMKHWLRHSTKLRQRNSYRSWICNQRLGFIVETAFQRAIDRLEQMLLPRPSLKLRAFCSGMRKYPIYRIGIGYDKFGIATRTHNRRSARKYHQGRWALTKREWLKQYWARLDKKLKGKRRYRNPDGPASLNKWHGSELKWKRPTGNHRAPREWPQS